MSTNPLQLPPPPPPPPPKNCGIPPQRRRRRCGHPGPTTMTQQTAGKRRRRRPCLDLVDDANFLERQKQEEEGRRLQYIRDRSVLGLLLERENGGFGYSGHNNNDNNRRRRNDWQKRMIFQPVFTTSTDTEEDEEEDKRKVVARQCRPWMEQKIPFTALETPLSVAILALEANTGSYALGLIQQSSTSCTNHHTNHNPDMVTPTLALQLYGLPSHNSFAQKRRMDLPGRQQQQQQQRRLLTARNRLKQNKQQPSLLVAPKLMTIPLAFDDDDDNNFQQQQEDPFEQVFGHKMNNCVDLAISSDWRLGLAIVWMPQKIASRTDISATTSTRMASLILFPLTSTTANTTTTTTDTKHLNDPSSASDTMSIFRAMLVPVSAVFGIGNGGRNLLWNVSCVPVLPTPPQTTWKVDNIRRIPAYLVLIDDAEGYRLSWIADSTWQVPVTSAQDEESFSLDPVTLGTGPTNASGWKKSFPPIIVPISKSDPFYWKERVCVRQSGSAWLEDEEDVDDDSETTAVNGPSAGLRSQLRIIQEGQLLILPLLSDILERRPSLRGTRDSLNTHQIRHYQKEYSLSDIPDFAYELVSISHGGRVAKLVLGFPTNISSTKQPHQPHNNNKAMRRHSHYFVAVLVALDLWTQCYQEIQWAKSPATTKASPSSLAKHIQKLALDFRLEEVHGKPPPRDPEAAANAKHAIPPLMDVLYPDCDTVSNRTVLWGLPVLSISSRSPVQLIYG